VGTHPDKPEYDIGANPCPQFYQQLIDKSGWKTRWKGWNTPVSVNGSKRRGIGTSIHNCRHGALANPESATIMLEPDGTCRVVTGSQECGNGWRTAATLMAAEEMGIHPDRVKTPNFNTDTGEVTVQEIILGCGVGRDIFHMGNYNQIIGGMAMMVGHALFAGIYKDEATGIDLNPDYSLFKCPTFMDMPAKMDVVMYEEIDPYGPFGAKGTGEPVMPTTTPSILNAIYNALGGLPARKRIFSTMATPDKVLAAIGK
jgi:CO/xanthine dehydrogenase Mo-binding subunit